MNKKIIPSIILSSVLFSIASCDNSIGEEFNVKEKDKYYVNFMLNYAKERIDLSSGREAITNCLLYKSLEVALNSKVSAPTNPTRQYYEFDGWYLEPTCENAFDFNTLINSNTYVYAKWSVVEAQITTEPQYTEPSHIDDSMASIFDFKGVLHNAISNDKVNLPTASLNRLAAKANNCLSLLDYKMKKDVVIDEAKYANNKITLKAHLGTTNYQKEITVVNSSGNFVISNSTYETKAKNYENNASNKENYHVMLGGSSSMENWSTSTEDMNPVVSYNHGIGGTTIEQWTNSLNERLVYPFNPKLVVYYVGINNVINSHDSADVIYTKLETFFNTTHSRLGDVPIYYILMNLIPGYTTYYDVINNVNERVETFASNKDWLNLIDAGTALLKENGRPNDAYFLNDGLHMSKAGYVIWGQIVKNAVIDGLRKL